MFTPTYLGRITFMALLAPFLAGCVFVGSRQEIGTEPVKFIDSQTGSELAEVLILQRYTIGDKMLVAKPFVYLKGTPIRLEPPTSSGVILGTTFVGGHKSLDGFLVFAKGYKPRWGGMGTREYFDEKSRRTIVVREVMLDPVKEPSQSLLGWLAHQTDKEQIEITTGNMSLFDLGAIFPVFNSLTNDERVLVKSFVGGETIQGVPESASPSPSPPSK